MPAVRRSRRGAVPAIYRLRLANDEKLSAIYFNPNETKMPPIIFGPFFDGGQMVTPCYWGSHWPLARGNSTGRDDRRPDPVHADPQQRDELGGTRPAPLSTSEP